MAYRLPTKCCWLCKYATPRGVRSIQQMLALPQRGDRIICTNRRRDRRTAYCPRNPYRVCDTRLCNGAICDYWTPNTDMTWLRGKENQKVRDCEHKWYLAGIAVPHFILWCSKCGSVMKTNKRESEKNRTWHTLWDEKCKHNPKHPRIMIESPFIKPSEAEEEVQKLRRILAALAKKHGMLLLSEADRAKVGEKPSITINITPGLGVMRISEDKDGKATAARKSDS